MVTNSPDLNARWVLRDRIWLNHHKDFVLTTIALAQPWAEANPGMAGTVDIADPGPTVTRNVNTSSPSQVRIRRDDGDDEEATTFVPEPVYH